MVSSGETAPNATCSIDDALKFLKGPSDEHRFAGLLLVPKVCAQNGAVKYKQLYDALGLDFLWRLLVPLRDPRFIATVDNPEDVKKQLLGVTLSLSVISILTRDASVAQDPELIKLFPCLARIVRSKSLSEACGKQSDPSEPDPQPSEAADAVEIVWNICSHEQEAVRIALESRLLSSVAAWLSRSFLVQPTEVLKCGLSLLFTVAQPLLQQEDGESGLGWLTDQVAFPPEILGSEIRAAVEGVSYICFVDCTAEQDDASGVSARKALQLYGFSVLAALAPAMQQCPEAVQAAAGIPEHDESGVYSIAWCNNLKTASLRALKNKLPPQHTMNILLALQTMTDQYGAAALLQKSEGGAPVTELMLTVSQVIKVNIFSHLQGCSLEIQAGRGSQPLPSHLLTSQSSFRAAVHMMAQLVDLAIMLDSSADEPDEQEPCSSSQKPLVTTAAMEGTIIEALLAVKDTVQSMLDFILLCVKGDLVDGPEPEQIPKGFRRPEPAPNQSTEATDQTQHDLTPSLAASTLQMKRIGADGSADCDATPDPNWAQDCLQQCCHCVGYFLSMAGDEDLFLKLFSGLPDICSWMLGTNDKAPVQFVETPVAIRDVTKSIMLALYSTHVLRSAAPAVVSACTKACEAPEVVICLCTCCRSMIDSIRTEAEVSTEHNVWNSRFLSPVETICELITSVLSSKTEVAGNADSLYAKLHASATESDDSTTSDSLMQQTALAVHKFVGTIAPTLGEHANSCEDGEDVAAIVDTIVATAELMLITTNSSVTLHPGEQRWIDVVAAVTEALRIAVEYVLRVIEVDYTPLIRSLVSSGQDSKSCWSGGGEHLLFACVEDDVDVSRVADKCAQICSRLCACLEEQETATKLLCEQTWMDPWLRSNDHVYQIVSVLENSEETVSLGHSLRLLAVSLQE